MSAPTPTPPAVRRIGLGLAAVGRPGYITLGRDRDLPQDRSVDALRQRVHELLDLAYASGVRRVDAARSYGRAEEFLADWLHDVGDRPGLVVSSKWGYTYTADWHVHAEAHEIKDHGVATYERQIAETRALLGDHLDVYQIHSLTPDSPALTDTELHRRLAELAATGVTVGVSVSGPGQGEAIRAALAVEVDGRPLFRSVQATWNPLEPSAGPALAEAHAAGCTVMVKEGVANGRLAVPDPDLDRVLLPLVEATGTSRDAVALAAALHQPWADVVLSGAATTAQLTSNLRAADVHLSPVQLDDLAALAEPPAAYWTHRSRLPWH
ncbi:aldo/keto reductase [Actinacidiphila rubida]|uniref:Predicted oxidoreductase n=1 Tax=Actinacidiphila rubida TaxID=310780 RepID=A0A1H8NSL6_9ACTN|nr:aldo/keto reductase [Actinacidiphila rubida]SEO32579.1 Predicted oxidoreductase [Actinacidiphila rubida]